MNFPSPTEFGVYLGVVLDGVSPVHIPQMIGLAKVAASPAADVMNRLVLRVTADLMEQCGYGGQAPTLHLKMAASDQTERYIGHRRELVGLVTESLRRYASLQKQALSFSDVTNAMGTVLQAGGLAAAGVGAAGGAGLWAIKKQLNEQDLKARATEASADYYNQMTDDLNARLKQRYGYADAKPSALARRQDSTNRRLVERARWEQEQEAAKAS